APVAPGAGTPTGTVTFDFGDGSPTVAEPLVGGVASTNHTYTTTAGSPFTLTATYSGDANFDGSVGGGSHTVEAAETTTALTDVPDPSLVGQPVTFTATVSPVAPGAGTPTGTVVFDFGDGNVSPPVALVGGVATTSHAYLTTVGSPFTISATYSGDADFDGSSTPPGQTHTVNQSATTTSVFDDLPDPSVVGQPVTFTAHVNPVAPGGGTPTGSVVFDFGDGNVSPPVPLVGGVATTSHAYLTTSGSPFTVNVTYSGDVNYTASAGAGGHTVNAASTTTALTDVPDPSAVAESVTFTATVAPVAPGAGTPTGTVTFDFGDGSPTVAEPLVGGVATTDYAYTTTAGSPFTISAAYTSDDGDYLVSSDIGTHTVN
ncbi:Ig-like domain-containing protein, partial [Streptomyces abyssalis]